MDLVTAVIIIGIGNGFLEGIALILLHRGNLRANRVLGVLVIILALCVAGMLMISIHFYDSYPHFMLLTQPLLFLFGPLFWIYVELMTHRITRLRPGLLLHGIPFLACIVYRIPFYLMSGAGKLAQMHIWETETIRSDMIVTWLQVVHILIYLLVVLRQLRLHESTVKEEYSSTRNIGLRWVRIFVISIGAFTAVMAVFVLLDVFGYELFVHKTSGILGLLLPLALGYYGLRQPEIFLGLAEPEPLRRKYLRSAVAPEKSDEYLARLIALMDEEKPYHNSNLTIHELAARLDVPVHHLSQIINDKLGQNFFDFVNAYRIREVQSRIAGPAGRNLTLMAIALDAGFNSKSVFNTAFKKATGITPSEYRASMGNAEKL